MGERTRSILCGAMVVATACSAFVRAPPAPVESSAADWGFYVHRRLNRFAVFTLPAELAGFYKRHLEYLAEHSVDPDKRRYAVEMEARRHYIDLEYYGQGAIDRLPRRFDRYHAAYTELGCVLAELPKGSGTDTAEVTYASPYLKLGSDSVRLDSRSWWRWYGRTALPAYYQERDTIHAPWPDTVRDYLPVCDYLALADTITQHGTLPYTLQSVQRQLVDAMRAGRVERILRLSADLGHYVGDATVPLHTTTNYDGQLTGQKGIHSFWESRIPELSESDYDRWVGPARYVATDSLFFALVRESHDLLPVVLAREREVRAQFPAAAQSCFEERLGEVTAVPCRNFALAYERAMEGMVEARYRRAIAAIGACWYSAWIDAGRPRLSALDARLDGLTPRWPMRAGLEGRGH